MEEIVELRLQQIQSDLKSSINDMMTELKGFLRAADVPVPYILSVGCACRLSFKAIFMHKICTHIPGKAIVDRCL